MSSLIVPTSQQTKLFQNIYTSKDSIDSIRLKHTKVVDASCKKVLKKSEVLTNSDDVYGKINKQQYFNPVSVIKPKPSDAHTRDCDIVNKDKYIKNTPGSPKIPQQNKLRNNNTTQYINLKLTNPKCVVSKSNAKTVKPTSEVKSNRTSSKKHQEDIENMRVSVNSENSITNQINTHRSNAIPTKPDNTESVAYSESKTKCYSNEINVFANVRENNTNQYKGTTASMNIRLTHKNIAADVSKVNSDGNALRNITSKIINIDGCTEKSKPPHNKILSPPPPSREFHVNSPSILGEVENIKISPLPTILKKRKLSLDNPYYRPPIQRRRLNTSPSLSSCIKSNDVDNSPSEKSSMSTLPVKPEHSLTISNIPLLRKHYSKKKSKLQASESTVNDHKSTANCHVDMPPTVPPETPAEPSLPSPTHVHNTLLQRSLMLNPPSNAIKPLSGGHMDLNTENTTDLVITDKAADLVETENIRGFT